MGVETVTSSCAGLAANLFCIIESIQSQIRTGKVCVRHIATRLQPHCFASGGDGFFVLSDDLIPSRQSVERPRISWVHPTPRFIGLGRLLDIPRDGVVIPGGKIQLFSLAEVIAQTESTFE